MGTSSISQILGGRHHEQPPEIELIKKFVNQKIKLVPTVVISQHAFTICLPNAGAAGSLRPHLYELETLLGQKKRLLIRIVSQNSI